MKKQKNLSGQIDRTGFSAFLLGKYGQNTYVKYICHKLKQC